MNDDKLKDLKPFFSILIIIGTLFALVFLQMEERRIGYALLKQTREHNKIVEQKRIKTIALAKITRPEHVEKMAETRLTLKKIQANQIIHLSGASLISDARDVH